MSSPAKAAASVMLISLLGIPATYVVNTAQNVLGERGLLVAGVASLVGICLLTYVALSSFNQPKDWLFYVFTLSTFSSVVDIIIGLENDGYISGFMTNYLKNGEPYLNTPYGSVICYWDGTVHYALYLIMLTAMAYRWNYRVFGLYWVGSIGHNMVVLLPGAILSTMGVRWSFCLTIPYVIIPIVSTMRFLRERPAEPVKPKVESVDIDDGPAQLFRRPFDLVFIFAATASILVAFLRGFAVLGCTNPVTVAYIQRIEPYLMDPVAFPKAQMLVYVFYFVPFYALSIYSLLKPGCCWMPDWAVILAGAAAQAQVAHIVSSLHPRTAPEYRVPSDGATAFWVINASLLVLPHLLALRCWAFPSYFSTPALVEDGAKAAKTSPAALTNGSKQSKLATNPRPAKKFE